MSDKKTLADLLGVDPDWSDTEILAQVVESLVRIWDEDCECVYGTPPHGCYRCRGHGTQLVIQPKTGD